MSMNERKHSRIQSVAAISLALAVTAGIAGCGKDDAQALVEQARTYAQKGEHKAAVIQLKNALQENPEHREARYLLGTVYLQTGDGASAEKEIRKAISLGADAAQAMPHLARALMLQGEFQKVLEETEAAAAGDAGILGIRGNALLALGQQERAREALEAALKASPDHPEALIGLARLALMQKDAARAEQLIGQATGANPQHIETWMFKGDLERSQNRPDGAVAAYGEVLKIKPDHAGAHLARANVRIGAGKFDEAEADIQAARKTAPGSLMVHYTQALLDFSRNKHAAALESLQQVLRAAPEHMPSVLLAGAVQYALGSHAQAEQHLKAYLEQNPGNLYARKLLASTLLKSRQPERAIAVLDPAVRDDTKDAQLLMLAGEAHMHARQFEKANALLERASELAPDVAMVHTALGMSSLSMGESERGIAALEKAAAMDNASERPGILLVMTHLRNKDFDKALAAAEKLEQQQPDNPMVANLKGGAYLGKNDPANARKSFEKALALQPGYFPATQNLAHLALRNKQPEEARKHYLAALEHDKKSLQAMVALAGLEYGQGKHAESVIWLERALNENPDAAQPVGLLVAHYLRQGEKDKALSLAARHQSARPTDPKFLLVLAEAQAAGGDARAALGSFEKLAALQPQSAQVQHRIALLHQALKNESAAETALKKARQLDPDYLPALLSLAGIDVRNGRFDDALAIAARMQKQRAGDAAGYMLEGDVLVAQKKLAPAIAAYERAVALDNSGLATVKLHGAQVQAGKAAAADAQLAQWLKKHPADMRVRMYLANHQLTTRQYKAAIEQLQAVVRLDPKNVLALNNLAWALGEEKDGRALQVAEEAYKLAPQSAPVLDTLGWLVLQKGDAARALPLLQKASSMAPENGEIRYHYALALAKTGDKAGARKEIEQLLANAPAFDKADEARAFLKQL